MTRPGPKPKPVEQRRREGKPRSPQQPATPLIVGGREKPTPSDHLSDEAKGFFAAIVDEMWSSGVLDKADRLMVELAAMEQETIAACNRDIAARGYVVRQKRAGYNGSQARYVMEPNPSVSMREKAIARSQQVLDLLGVGPSARARLAGLGVKGKTPAEGIPGLGTLQTLRGGKTA